MKREDWLTTILYFSRHFGIQPSELQEFSIKDVADVLDKVKDQKPAPREIDFR